MPGRRPPGRLGAGEPRHATHSCSPTPPSAALSRPRAIDAVLLGARLDRRQRRHRRRHRQPRVAGMAAIAAAGPGARCYVCRAHRDDRCRDPDGAAIPVERATGPRPSPDVSRRTPRAGACLQPRAIDARAARRRRSSGLVTALGVIRRRAIGLHRAALRSAARTPIEPPAAVTRPRRRPDGHAVARTGAVHGPASRSARPATGSCCASSWSRTGCSPPTPSATSTIASSRGRAGASRSTAAGRRGRAGVHGPVAAAAVRDGRAGGRDGVLRDVIRPRAAYLAAAPELLERGRAVYRVDAGPTDGPDVGRPDDLPARPGAAIRLVPADIGDLNRLYDLGLTSWLPVGVGRQRRLLRRPGQRPPGRRRRHPRRQPRRCGLAAVGNVLTHRDYRGPGLRQGRDERRDPGAAALLRPGRAQRARRTTRPRSRPIGPSATSEHIRFEERLVHRRGTLWDSIVAPIRRWIPPDPQEE